MTKDENMHVVKDGARHLKFEGEKLSESSSRTHGRTRWIEFQLYRTTGGQYVLSRVGVSLYYHSANCAIVSRNKIQGVATEDVPAILVPCEQCSPVPGNEDVLYPEQARHWAQASDSAEGVVESLWKYDEAGARYLTHVARKLLETAARIDDGIAEAYFEEFID
jgi:hypothetical protein